VGAIGVSQSVSRGYVLTAPGKLEIAQRTLPDLPPGWVRLRFLYCGLCGSDIAQFRGRPSATYPTSVGHEFVAEVVAVGAEVVCVSFGDLVTSDLNYRCGDCDHCFAGRSHLCRQGQRSLFTNRAFSEFGDIDASYLLRLNRPAVPHLSLCEPLSCVLHAKDLINPRPGDRVLLVGAGGLGLCLAFALCAQRPMIEFDVTDISATRLAALAGPIVPIGSAISQPPGEYDVVFDLTGNEEGLRAASHQVRDGGRICSMGHPIGEEIDPVFLSDVLPKDVIFVTSYLNGEPSVLREAADLLEREWDPSWDKLIELISINDLQRAHEERSNSAACKTVVDVASGLD
jgi:threonine dehydrogenase-like Zn-dependent dehydrogenase